MCVKEMPTLERLWFRNFRQLDEFYKEHGHLIIPSDHPDYTRWSNWLAYQRNHSESLHDDKRDLMERINYKDPTTYRKTHCKTWETRYEELKQFHIENKHVEIGMENQPLSNWLSIQRRAVRFGRLDPKRVEKLQEVGVNIAIWKCPVKPRKISRTFEHRWQAHFEELKDYQRANGNCKVPRQCKENQKFATWVNTQRQMYKKAKKGESNMPADRIKKLEELGFDDRL